MFFAGLHTAEDYLDRYPIVEKSGFPIKREVLVKYLGKKVFLMEEHSALDGKFSETVNALDELWRCAGPYILYGNNCFYVETEYNFSVHAAYVMKRNDKI